ncbi:hypothetical protein DFQ30_009810 [Apophysomyces sp. BC1015]|nr:hypothetical protein DFQ30_009810 [Apophysomyces sp. BC1015]
MRNSIAEQLGVPKEYVVRHAAFIYETQLRGIHQQLRLSEVGKTPSSSPSTPQPPPSPSPQTQSLGITGRSNLSSRPSSRRQAQSPSRNTLTPSTWRDSSQAASSLGTATIDVPATEDHSLNSVADVSVSEAKGREGSMMLSTISTILPRSTSEKQVDGSEESVYKSFTSQTSRPFYSPPQSFTSSNVVSGSGQAEGLHQEIDAEEDDEQDEDISAGEEEEEKEEEEFDTHFAKMRLELEEPAFLPRNNLSQSISRKDSTVLRQLTTENKADERQTTTSKHIIRTTNTSPPPPRKVFGPSQTRTSPPSAHDNIVVSDDSGKEASSALNSVGSSFSDLSDSSITQSALEDAFLSKFNNGSKM